MASKTEQVASLAHQADQVATKIADFLEGLDFGEWARPSACTDWTVAELVGHLVLVEALLSGGVNRGLRGDNGLPPQAEGRLEGWRDYRSREIRRLGGLAPAELLALYRAGLEPMRTALGRLASGEDNPAGGWHPWGVQPLEWFAGQWLVEVALHDWDIRVGADPSARVRPQSFAGLGPEMRARMGRCFRPELAPPVRGVVRIALEGTAPYAWLARLSEHGLELLDDGAAEPDATISSDPGSYALVQTGRRSVADLGDERWRVSGNLELATGLAGALRGY